MHKLTIFVPSTQQNGSPCYPPQRWQVLHDLKVLMVETWGGVTVVDSEGGWKHADGRIVFEAVTLVTSLTAGALPSIEAWAARECHALARELNQERILYTVETVVAGFLA